ncbi:MAG: two-component regulator propeller domain-containing protein [Bacteroidota bacterium]
MHRNQIRLWLAALFIIVLSENLLFAQEQTQYRFDQLRVEQGLSQGSINAILQGKRGFLYIATDDGLNRFDGYQFLVFRPNSEDSMSISTNIITALAEDASGLIWIGTAGSGFQSYDPVMRQFESYTQEISAGVSFSNTLINALAVDRRGHVWIGSDNRGLLEFDPAAGALKTHALPGIRAECNVLDIQQTSSGNLLIVCEGEGLFLLNPASRKAEKITIPLDPATGLSRNVLRIAMEGARYLWVGMQDGLLFRYDIRTGKWEKHVLDSAPLEGYSVEIRDLSMDRNGNLWICTVTEGLYLINTADGKITHLKRDILVPGSIPSNSLRSLYVDRLGNVWVGMNGSGLALYSPSTKEFNLLMPGATLSGEMTIYSSRAIYQDQDSVLWLGGYAGFNKLDRKTGKVTVFARDLSTTRGVGPFRGMNSGNVFAISPDPSDPKDYLLIGTEGDGLYRFNKRTERFWRIPIIDGEGEPLDPAVSLIFEITTARNGEIWLGGASGLYRWHRAGKGSIPKAVAPQFFGLSQGGVYAILEDHNGLLWIGTGRGGLALYDRLNDDVTMFRHSATDSTSLSSDAVKCIYEDSRGILWIGTALGLNRMDLANGTFTSYTTRQGLPNDVIYGILEDERGYLWLSTNRGLARFHPEFGVVSVYDVHDNLQGNEFNTAAFFKSANGEMFFGGVQGLTYFYPRRIVRNQTVPPIAVTNVRVGNRTVLLRNAGIGPDTVRLEYQDESVTFTFAALSFYRAEKNRYRYRLEGRNEEWIELGYDRFLSFAGLSPGEYVLKVQGSNNDGVWNVQGVTITLIINPPFWATWWFRIGLILLLIGILVIGLRWRIRRMRSDERRLTTEVQLRTSELQHSNANLLVEIDERKRAEAEADRANATKSEFLAHISHEIRTPMNAILGFTELISDRIHEEDLRGHLNSISLSGRTLITLINDILDLSKIEAGKLELVYRPTSIRGIVSEICQLFGYQVGKKELSIEALIEEDVPHLLYLDETRIRQILLNLVGNAVKFTNKGTITIKLKSVPTGKDRCTLKLIVKDTGVGIAPSQQQRVFEPFRQGGRGRNTEYGGTGLGLAITQRLIEMMNGEIALTSKLGSGSSFYVTLPSVTIASESSGSATFAETRQMPLMHDAQPASRVQTGADAPYVIDVNEYTSQDGEVTVSSPEEMRALYYDLAGSERTRWERLTRTFLINEIEEFAERLREKSLKAHYLPFILWSERLLREVRSFDMEILPVTLSEFPDLLAVLEEQGNPSASSSEFGNHD